MKRDSFLKTGVIYLSTLFLVLALAEVVLRFVAPVQVFRPAAADPLAEVTGWAPSAKSDGSRLCDTSHEWIKSPDKIRVLLLGDSILDCNESGTQPFLGSVPALLAARLGDRYEVINISAGGWGNDQQFLAWRTLGRKYRPDLVLLFFTPANDIINNSSKKALFQDVEKPYFELKDNKLFLRPLQSKKEESFFRRALYRTQLGTRFWLAAKSFKEKVEAQSLAGEANSHLLTFIDPWPDSVERGWEITQAILLQMKHEIENDASRFAVVYVPNGAVLTPLWSGDASRLDKGCAGYSYEKMSVRFGKNIYQLDLFEPYRLMKAFCRTSGIPLVDDLEVLKPYQNRHREICYDGLHLSRKGAELLTDSVTGFIRSSRASVATRAFDSSSEYVV